MILTDLEKERFVMEITIEEIFWIKVVLFSFTIAFTIITIIMEFSFWRSNKNVSEMTPSYFSSFRRMKLFLRIVAYSCLSAFLAVWIFI